MLISGSGITQAFDDVYLNKNSASKFSKKIIVVESARS